MAVNIKEMIADADYVLIGIGEEFNSVKALRQDERYEQLRAQMEGSDSVWMLPALNRCMLKKGENRAQKALERLQNLVKDKNYFVVSVCTNGVESDAGFDMQRVVSPCGGPLKVQCADRCGAGVRELADTEVKGIEEALGRGSIQDWPMGCCEVCGAPLVLNSVYTEKYDEKGYLSMWEEYTKWLQKTLNRKVCVLELGVGLTYPSVIRWPFEKIGFFNQKASFVRVHETLYQLSEDLKDKGISVAQNSIDWLLGEDL